MEQFFKASARKDSVSSNGRKRGGSAASSASNGTDSLRAYKWDRSHSEVKLYKPRRSVSSNSSSQGFTARQAHKLVWRDIH